MKEKVKKLVKGITSQIPILLVLLDLHYEGVEGVNKPEAQKHLTIGNQLLHAGQLVEALTQFHTSIDSDPTNYQAYYMRATVYLAMSKSRAALPDLDQVIKLKPNFVKARLLRGNLNLKMGRFNVAQMDYEAVLSQEDNAEAKQKVEIIRPMRRNINMASQLFEAHDYKQVIQIFKEVIETCPWNAEFRETRALAYERIGDLRSAISDLKPTTTLRLDNTHGHLRISILYYNLGDIEQSLEEIRECLKLDPDHKECYAHYKSVKKLFKTVASGKKLMTEEMWDDANEKFLKALQQEPRIPAFTLELKLKICECSVRKQSPSEALTACKEVLGMNENSVPALLLLSEAYTLNSQYQEALDTLQKASQIDENYPGLSEKIKKAQKMLKQSQKRDYYKILGVSRNARKKDIVKAYRNLAREWHPDNFKGEEDKKMAESKFIDLAAAKEVLTDPDKIRIYSAGYDPLDSDDVAEWEKEDAGENADNIFKFFFQGADNTKKRKPLDDIFAAFRGKKKGRHHHEDSDDDEEEEFLQASRRRKEEKRRQEEHERLTKEEEKRKIREEEMRRKAQEEEQMNLQEEKLRKLRQQEEMRRKDQEDKVRKLRQQEEKRKQQEQMRRKEQEILILKQRRYQEEEAMRKKLHKQGKQHQQHFNQDPRNYGRSREYDASEQTQRSHQQERENYRRGGDDSGEYTRQFVEKPKKKKTKKSSKDSKSGKTKKSKKSSSGKKKKKETKKDKTAGIFTQGTDGKWFEKHEDGKWRPSRGPGEKSNTGSTGKERSSEGNDIYTDANGKVFVKGSDGNWYMRVDPPPATKDPEEDMKRRSPPKQKYQDDHKRGDDPSIKIIAGGVFKDKHGRIVDNSGNVYFPNPDGTLRIVGKVAKQGQDKPQHVRDQRGDLRKESQQFANADPQKSYFLDKNGVPYYIDKNGNYVRIKGAEEIKHEAKAQFEDFQNKYSYREESTARAKDRWRKPQYEEEVDSDEDIEVIFKPDDRTFRDHSGPDPRQPSNQHDHYQRSAGAQSKSGQDRKTGDIGHDLRAEIMKQQQALAAKLLEAQLRQGQAEFFDNNRDRRRHSQLHEEL